MSLKTRKIRTSLVGAVTLPEDSVHVWIQPFIVPRAGADPLEVEVSMRWRIRA